MRDAKYAGLPENFDKGLLQWVKQTPRASRRYRYAAQAYWLKTYITVVAQSIYDNPNIFLPATGRLAFKMSPDKDSVM